MIDYSQTEMLKLKSIGDRFPPKKLTKIYSCFEQAVNFKNGEMVVSLVSPQISAGPFRIVLQGIKPESILTCERTEDSVILNDKIVLSYTNRQIYQSANDFDDSHPDNISVAITELRNLFIQKGMQSTLLILFDAGQHKEGMTAFEQTLATQFQQAFNLLQKSEYEQAVLGFKGRGYGLTPAGDDFNAGLLLGLKFREQTEKKELSKIRSVIYHNSLGQNLLVNTFLLQSYRGWYDEKWKYLLLALNKQRDNIKAALDEILKQGETSGADALAGFLAAWEIKI